MTWEELPFPKTGWSLLRDWRLIVFLTMVVCTILWLVKDFPPGFPNEAVATITTVATLGVLVSSPGFRTYYDGIYVYLFQQNGRLHIHKQSPQTIQSGGRTIHCGSNAESITAPIIRLRIGGIFKRCIVVANSQISTYNCCWQVSSWRLHSWGRIIKATDRIGNQTVSRLGPYEIYRLITTQESLGQVMHGHWETTGVMSNLADTLADWARHIESDPRGLGQSRHGQTLRELLDAKITELSNRFPHAQDRAPFDRWRELAEVRLQERIAATDRRKAKRRDQRSP
ncbi:hypothetical protein KKG41_04905 [Patescibacteria group bacterium]|nr:hypothetical protein [Patescibacteria group bacterium]